MNRTHIGLALGCMVGAAAWGGCETESAMRVVVTNQYSVARDASAEDGALSV